MILIGLLFQVLIYYTIKKNQALIMVGVGFLSSSLNFIDMFSNYGFLELSLNINVFYLLICFLYLFDIIKNKRNQPLNIILFTAIYSTANIQFIAFTTIGTLLFTHHKDLSKNFIQNLKALCLISLASFNFIDWSIFSGLLFASTVLYGLYVVRELSATGLCYYLTLIMLTSLTLPRLYVIVSVGVILLIFFVKYFLETKKEKIIQNNILDKLIFYLMLKKTVTFESETTKPNLGCIEKQNTKPPHDIKSYEEVFDVSILIVILLTFVYLGVQYGNL